MDELLNKIVCADCIELLDGINKPFADLIFADPPFNIGYKYDEYKDKLKKDKYIHWTRDWMRACYKVLKPAGSFYIAIGDEYAANIKIIADELGLYMRNWIIWHYTFGQHTKRKFARSHTHIFYFTKDKTDFTFNDKAVRIPSQRQLTYNDKRANSKGKIPGDVWNEFPRVCGTFKEREGWHPCQMPLTLLQRIIAVSSSPGECVFDPFAGSGTTAAAAYLLGRNYCGTDISTQYVEKTRERLEKLKEQPDPESLFLSREDITELKRLAVEMQVTPEQLEQDKKTFRAFRQQFSIRTGREINCSPNEIISALRDS